MDRKNFTWFFTVSVEKGALHFPEVTFIKNKLNIFNENVKKKMKSDFWFF